jgi:hypothetical protein
MSNRIEVVHGWISPEGRHRERRLHHAWIEIGDGVLETQGGMAKPHSKTVYYDWYAAYPTERYSVIEAYKLAFPKKEVTDFSLGVGKVWTNRQPEIQMIRKRPHRSFARRLPDSS